MRKVAKHDQVGYQSPADRPGCRNCKHFAITRHDSPVIPNRSGCLKHGLEVTSGGICNDHSLQRKPGQSELDFLSRQRDLLQAQLDKPAPAPQVRECSRLRHQVRTPEGLTPAEHTRQIKHEIAMSRLAELTLANLPNMGSMQ